MSKQMILIALLGALMACDGEGGGDETGLDTGACVPACPEGENTSVASDVPCDEDDGDDATIEEGCQEIESCGEIIYCRMTGV